MGLGLWQTCPTSLVHVQPASTSQVLLQPSPSCWASDSLRFHLWICQGIFPYSSYFLYSMLFYAICASWDVAFILSLVVIGSYTIYNQRPSKTTSTVSTKDHKIPQVCSLVNNADLPNLRVAIIATSATLRDARWGPTIPTNLEPSSAKSMFPGLSQRKIWSHVAVIFRGFTGSTKKQHKDHSRSTGHTALLKDHKCGKNSPAGFKSFKSIQIGSKFWKHFTSVTQNDTQT